MPPAEAKENLVLDALVAAVEAIGPVGASWHTNPTVYRGVPGDPVPATPLEQIYVDYLQTEPTELAGATGLTSHGYRASYQVTYFKFDSQRVQGKRAVLNMLDDGRRALYAAEGAVQVLVGHIHAFGVANFQPAMTDAGFWRVDQLVTVDFEDLHA